MQNSNPMQCSLLALILAVPHAFPAPQAGRAGAVLAEVERLARELSVWPSFDPLAFPLAAYDGEHTYLSRHPSPPDSFTELPADQGVLVHPGRHPLVTANSSAEIGGVLTATIVLDRVPADRSIRELAALALHETFHVFQRLHHPGWQGDEGSLFLYPVERPDLLALRRKETEALRRALAAPEAEAACWARQALDFRAARFTLLDTRFSEYERLSELNEGLAAYVQHRFAGGPPVLLPPGGFGAEAVRDRVYASGEALALLLDRFASQWKETLESADDRSLDELLRRALSARLVKASPGTECGLTKSEEQEFEQAAEVEAAGVSVRRAARKAAFEELTGDKVIVEAQGEPLWLQGFDPLNVVPVPGGILHSRFLRLSNQSGSLEVINGQALTESAGEHPLFNGVRRVTLAGLSALTVEAAEGSLQVRSPELQLSFRIAGLQRSGDVLTIRLASP